MLVYFTLHMSSCSQLVQPVVEKTGCDTFGPVFLCDEKNATNNCMLIDV